MAALNTSLFGVSHRFSVHLCLFCRLTSEPTDLAESRRHPARLHSILQSAAATAYENADNQSGSNHQIAMGVVHLIELAQLRMGLLEQQVVAASS